MDSENESVSNHSEEFENDVIDKFILDETPHIMDLYYDIRNRTPYFLDKLSLADLTCFIIDNKFEFYHDKKKTLRPELDYFEWKYSTEINSSLYVINQYLKKYKKCVITYNVFLPFSYDYTTLN